MRAVLGVVLGLAVGTGSWAAAAPAVHRGVLGASVQTLDSAPDVRPGEGGPYPVGLEVAWVVPGSAAEAAGIRVGDVVLALDGTPFQKGPPDPVVEFRARLRPRAPGDQVSLTILRKPLVTRVVRAGHEEADPDAVAADLGSALAGLAPGESLDLHASRGREVTTLRLALGPDPLDAPPVRPLLPDSAAHARLLATADPLEDYARAAIHATGLDADEVELEAGLAALHQTDDGFRTDDVAFVHRHPFRALAACQELAGSLAPRPTHPGAADLAARIVAAAARDRVDLSGLHFDPLPVGVSPEAHARALASALAETAKLRASAFRDLTSEERAFLAAHALELGKALEAGIYVHQDPDLARRPRVLRVLALAKKVHREDLYRAALSWARLADPRWLAALPRDLGCDPRASGDVILRQATPDGEIVFGGSGRNVYRDVDPAVIVDVGGDDVYANGAGASRFDARPVAAVIDLAGDDSYEATADGAQGFGFGGVGLLVDVAGDDRHVGLDWAQGGGLLGCGALVDLAGNDTYRVQHFGQGVAAWGLGFLLDAGGNDTYDALEYAQGLGLPGGIGVLQDGGGRDRYYAKGGFPTEYGTQGVFDAWSQGCGMGLRGLQSGGIGVLVDDGGDDDYDAGNFAQGGGYYFGLGVLEDRGRGRDHYTGSRYDMGFSAHQAVGAFLEDGGDDRYETRQGVIAGIAWDQSVTVFRDAGGDDTYVAGGFSLGASAHGSVCLFLDEGGSDRYSGTLPGQAGPNDYHGGTSLSLFLDLGQGRDVFQPQPPPSLVSVAPENGVVALVPSSLRRAASFLPQPPP